jgi:hypothetical protein
MRHFPLSLFVRGAASVALGCLLFAGADDTAFAQKRRPRKPAAAPVNPLVGKDVRITRNDGLEVSGKLFKLDMKEIVYTNAGGEQASIPLENVAVISLGVPLKRVDAKFVADARRAVDSLNRIATLVNGSPTFAQYDAVVVDARVAVESFLSKYSDYKEQADFFDSLRNALRGYEMVKPVWATLQGVDRRVSLTENSSELKPVLQAYPDLKVTEYNQNGRYPTDKVIAFVWNQVSKQLRDVRGKLNELASENP